MNDTRVYRHLGIVLAVAMLLPLLFFFCTFIKIKPLDGYVLLSPKPDFSVHKLFDGTYQHDYEKYINDNIGLRPFFVRLHNQMQYSLFDNIHANGVVVGKNNYLYEQAYLNAYNGVDYLGKNRIIEKTKAIRQLQDTLSAYGKTFFVCLAAGKATFYPEYFPDEYVKPLTDSTNYKQFTNSFKQYGVNHIDMNRWFLHMKDTCHCLIYPQYGIHWSFYGTLLAADSIIHYIETERNIQMPEMKVENVAKHSNLKYSDYDIAKGMNLLFQMKTSPMCYPQKVEFEKDSSSVQPKTIVISDSFYWMMFNTGFGRQVLSYGGFWYYNNQIYPDSFESPLNVSDIDIKQALMEADVVMLMSTESNLSNLGWGFIDNANDAFSCSADE